jgi:succinyl-CoA synthetase beta subunit
MLGNHLTAAQTGPDGMLVKRVYMAETVKFQQEYYLAMTIDRAKFLPVVILSKQGGVDIESTIQNDSGKLHKFWFSVRGGIDDNMISDIKNQMGFSNPEINNIADILKKMFQILVEKDATTRSQPSRALRGGEVCVPGHQVRI